MSSLSITSQIQTGLFNLQNRVSANWKEHKVEVITALAVAAVASTLAVASFLMTAGFTALAASVALAGASLLYTTCQLLRHVEVMQLPEQIEKSVTPPRSPIATIEDVEEVEVEKDLDADAEVLDLEAARSPERVADAAPAQPDVVVAPVEQDNVEAPAQPADVVEAPAQPEADESAAPADESTAARVWRIMGEFVDAMNGVSD